MVEGRVDERLVTSRLTIDLAALRQNWRAIAAFAPEAETGAAIKADAYGLGLEPVSAALAAEGCRSFFVANASEGMRCRAVAAEAEIYVLGGLSLEAAPYYHEASLIPVLVSADEVALWADWGRRSGLVRPCALHVDTGMNRLGMRAEEVERLAGDGRLRHSISPVLVMSHLACADEAGNPMNAAQKDRFDAVLRRFPGIRASLANSAGILQQAGLAYDLTRPGIALYGGEAMAGERHRPAPVATLEGRILQVFTARAGETVGYGATARLEHKSRIAIAGAGYADGISRSASGSGVAMRALAPGGWGWLGAGADGAAVPLLGRVSMDLAAFDVTDVPDGLAERAEWIEFFGPHVTVDDFARAAGTIGYEVLATTSRRAARRYLGG